MASFLLLFDRFALCPGSFIQGKELNIRAMLAQSLLDFQQQLALMGTGKFAQESAKLDALQAIIQAGIGDLQARAIVRDIVDQ
jgi:hypothetical protein